MLNQLKTIALLGVLSAILVLIGVFAAPGYLWLFVALAVAMNIGSYFFSDKIVLAINRAKPISEEQDPTLYRIVRELAAADSLPMPRVYMVDSPAPNAFATGRNPKHAVVAVTSSIRQLLTDRELRGVLAHELSHVRNRDVLIASVAAMIASGIAMIASVIKWGALFGFGDRDSEGGGNLLAALALAIIAPIAATIVQLAISRSREYGADASGARLSGDPMALADALAKLERGNSVANLYHPVGGNPATASLYITNPLSGQGLVRLFSTHPPTAERIKRLTEMAAARSRLRSVPSGA